MQKLQVTGCVLRSSSLNIIGCLLSKHIDTYGYDLEHSFYSSNPLEVSWKLWRPLSLQLTARMNKRSTRNFFKKGNYTCYYLRALITVFRIIAIVCIKEVSLYTRKIQRDICQYSLKLNPASVSGKTELSRTRTHILSL